MNSRKDIAKIIRGARRGGFVVDESSKHIKVLGPDGRFLVGISATPSDSLALRRIKCDLKKAGVL